MLDDWGNARGRFVKVFPDEYPRALGEMYAQRLAAKAQAGTRARATA